MTRLDGSRVSRRSFMKAAGLGAVGTGFGAVTLSAAQAEEQVWDYEADIIAVGSGGAALAAAAASVERGAKTFVLEKAPYIGGTTAKSGAGYWMPNNFVQQAAGIKDDRELFLNYCARVSFPELYRLNSPTLGLPENNYALLVRFWEEAGRVAQTLNDTGALPAAFATSWEGIPSPDYHAQLPENGLILGRQLMPLLDNGKLGFGADMVDLLSTYVEDNDGEIFTDHRVSKIIRNEDGRVVGVYAQTPDGLKKFKANKGVIFGSGGFTHNKHMATNFLRTPVLGGCAVPTNEGDLILMASEVGVQFGNLNEAWNQQVVLEEVLEFSSVPSGVFFIGGDSMIVVNKLGKRVFDEKYVYPERTRAHQVYDQWEGNYPNLYQIMIFDEAARQNPGYLVPAATADLPKYIISGNTLEELAANIQARFDSIEKKIGTYPLDKNFTSSLKSTIENFNTYAENGVDPDFHRGEAPIDDYFHGYKVDRGFPSKHMAPIAAEGPYYAVLLGAGTLDTKGGPVFDVNANVLDIHNNPIPGLYVAGNAGASPSGKSYLGAGGTLGLAITFGYLAAEHALAQA